MIFTSSGFKTIKSLCHWKSVSVCVYRCISKFCVFQKVTTKSYSNWKMENFKLWLIPNQCKCYMYIYTNVHHESPSLIIMPSCMNQIYVLGYIRSIQKLFQTQYNYHVLIAKDACINMYTNIISLYFCTEKLWIQLKTITDH